MAVGLNFGRPLHSVLPKFGSRVGRQPRLLLRATLLNVIGRIYIISAT
jgi:hypothetical protein